MQLLFVCFFVLCFVLGVFSDKNATVKDSKNTCLREKKNRQTQKQFVIHLWPHMSATQAKLFQASAVCIFVCDCMSCWRTPCSLSSPCSPAESQGHSNSPLAIEFLFLWTQFISFASAWCLMPDIRAQCQWCHSHTNKHTRSPIHSRTPNPGFYGNVCGRHNNDMFCELGQTPSCLAE